MAHYFQFSDYLLYIIPLFNFSLFQYPKILIGKPNNNGDEVIQFGNLYIKSCSAITNLPQPYIYFLQCYTYYYFEAKLVQKMFKN